MDAFEQQGAFQKLLRYVIHQRTVTQLREVADQRMARVEFEDTLGRGELFVWNSILKRELAVRLATSFLHQRIITYKGLIRFSAMTSFEFYSTSTPARIVSAKFG